MTGFAAPRPYSKPAPTADRAPQAVMVRMHDGELAGRVSVEVAGMLLDSGAAERVGKKRLRYLRLTAGIVIRESSHGWPVIEDERRKHGDKAVRRGIMHWDHRTVK